METDTHHQLLENNRLLAQTILSLANTQEHLMNYWEGVAQGLINDNRYLREQVALAMERRKPGRPRRDK